MTDILERLRTKGSMDINHCPQCGADDTDRIDGLIREAADEIEYLRREIAEMQEALYD